MPGMPEDGFSQTLPALPGFNILKQNVDLDIDFARRHVKGSTEITIQPQSRDLKHVRLHCRQCRPTSVQVQGINAKWECDDPYKRLRMPGGSDIHQYEMLKHKIDSSIGTQQEEELEITLPAKLKFQEIQVDPISALPQYKDTPSLQKQESDAMAILETPTGPAGGGPQFAPIMVYIEFEVDTFRDGLHWIGFEDDDNRYPHVYTSAKLSPGNTSCIFPCLDDATTRYSWEFAISCTRTIGDAFKRPQSEQIEQSQAALSSKGETASKSAAVRASKKRDQYYIDLTEEDAARELTILCVGEQIEDIPDPDDDTRHTVSFALTEPVTARHVGFAIGPFEHVDLGAMREAEDEEKLGQSAIKISGYCMPTRSDELRNAAMPVHLAIDHFGVNYGSFPFSHYQVLFLDDLLFDTVPVAGMTLCSSRLLFGEDILEPLNRNAKILIRAVADQWMGVNVIAKEPNDAWVIAGIAGYMTDLFGKRLFGNNEYRWAQKIAAEQVYDLDADRPSIHQLGSLLHIDSSIRDFVNLKSALVLFILDRRLIKASSSTGVTRIINKIFLNAKTGSLTNGELSTLDFQRTCEKLGHNKLDPFFKQWVYNAGCPIFEIKQRFNKKKLVVEMTITQRQLERRTKPEFAPANFMREIKEHVQEVWAPETQAIFTGPMTIRIHEADGTPYEHIVEIKEQVTKLEIPYNTKYKRLKRSRRQRERAMAASGNNNDPNEEGGNDALLYCLGDILDTAQEVEDWDLKDWSPEDEEKMGQESYEWIRMDADFEWIGRIHLWLPVYMYVSQLQQDRDLAAQYDSIKYIESCGAHHVSLSILVRTLMDQRYFHGIRTMAANAIATIAKDKYQVTGQHHLEKAFSTLFCFERSIMPRPNDWSTRVNFIVQCAIPQAMARIRDADNKVPLSIRKFFVDKLKFNDNSNNEYSDAHYVATLMSCLADSLAVSHREQKQSYQFDFDGGDDRAMDLDNADADFEKEAVSEIERYRRIDEWISTYQNIYSVTALDCLQKLAKLGIVKNKSRELLIYTRRTNAPDVRLAAFRCLNETGLSRQPVALKYMLHELADDNSPYFRSRLLDLFGEALGHIALSDDKPAEPATRVNDTGLVLEQEISAEARQIEVTRKTTPEGALAALKRSLSSYHSFQDALWYAITSNGMSIQEIGALVDIAALLYDARTSYMVKLRLPRPYRAQHVKAAIVRFTPVGDYRTQPRKSLSLDDWQALAKLRLKYTGPLSPEVEQMIEQKLEQDKVAISKEEALKSQIAALQQQLPTAAAPPSDTAAMPPPRPQLATEKTGLKLSLGAKRKSSTTPVDDQPKPAKLPKISLGSQPSTPAIERRASFTAPPKKAGTKMVVLKVGLAAQRKINDILAGPHRPASSHGRQSSATPSLQKPGIASPETLRNASFSGSPVPTPVLNPGGFRSYGAPSESSLGAGPPASPEVKREASESGDSIAVVPAALAEPKPSGIRLKFGKPKPPAEQ